LGLDETRLTRTSNAMGTFEACRRSGWAHVLLHGPGDVQAWYPTGDVSSRVPGCLRLHPLPLAWHCTVHVVSQPSC